MEDVQQELPQTRVFWVVLTIFGSVFATGLFILFQSISWGIFLTILGLVGMIVLVRDRVRAQLEQVPIRTPLRAVATVIVSMLVGYTASQIIEIQTALDTYVLPRAISHKQADDLREYLSHYAPSTVTIEVVANDEEASEYAAELFNALRQTDWDINPPAHGGPLSLKPEESYYKGLYLNVELVGDPTNADPKHPTPHAVLGDALRGAKIDVEGAGKPNKGKYSIFLVVGHRPYAIARQSWIREIISRFVN